MMAAQSGMSALSLAISGDSAQTIAAYNESYNAQYKKYAALDAKTTAESNISAIHQDLILTNLNIQMRQKDAEANAQVSAAVAGVSGSSVDAGMYQIGANAALQTAQATAQADQQVEQQLAGVNTAQTSYNSVQEAYVPSALDGALTGVANFAGSIDKQDMANLEAQWSK